MESGYAVIRLRVSKVLVNRLKRLCIKRGSTMNGLIRSICIDYVNQVENKEKFL